MHNSLPPLFKAKKKCEESIFRTKHIQRIVLQVGEKYALENEEELKDKMNFEEHPSYRLPTGNFCQ